MSGLFNGPCPSLLASIAGQVGNYNTSLQREKKKKIKKPIIPHFPARNQRKLLLPWQRGMETKDSWVLPPLTPDQLLPGTTPLQEKLAVAE